MRPSRTLRSLRALALFLPFLAIGFISPVFAEKAPIEDAKELAAPITEAPAEAKGPAQFAVRITRLGDFLKDISLEKRELFRRLGRKLAEVENKLTGNKFQAAGFAGPGTSDKPLATRMLEEKEWSAENRSSFDSLFQQGAEVFKALSAEIPSPATGLLIEAIAAPDQVVMMIDKFLDDPKAAKSLKPGQLFKLKNNFLPLMKMADRVVILGNVTPDGFKIRFRVTVAGEGKELIAEMAKTATTPTTARFADPEALVNVSQIQVVPPPATIMEQLKSFPQTAVIQGYLASAGLDLEKDILPTTAQDTLVTLNLTPTGEGGIPDLRVIAKLRDVANVEAMAPKLRQLAMSIGVYVVSGDAGGVPSTKISYFMAPNFGLHLALAEGHLILATGKENLASAISRVKEIQSGKSKGFEIPANVQRFWRVSLSRINEQLQRLLQSPLLANKGIPPVSNLSAADELGDLVLLTKVFEDRLEISVDLPVLPGK